MPTRSARVLRWAARFLVATLTGAEAVVWFAGMDSPGRLTSSDLTRLPQSAGAIGGLLLSLAGAAMAFGTLWFGWRIIGCASVGLYAVSGDWFAVIVPAVVCAILAVDSGLWLHGLWLVFALLVLMVTVPAIRASARVTRSRTSSAGGGEDR